MPIKFLIANQIIATDNSEGKYTRVDLKSGSGEFTKMFFKLYTSAIPNPPELPLRPENKKSAKDKFAFFLPASTSDNENRLRQCPSLNSYSL